MPSTAATTNGKNDELLLAPHLYKVISERTPGDGDHATFVQEVAESMRTEFTYCTYCNPEDLESLKEFIGLISQETWTLFFERALRWGVTACFGREDESLKSYTNLATLENSYWELNHKILKSEYGSLELNINELKMMQCLETFTLPKNGPSVLSAQLEKILKRTRKQLRTKRDKYFTVRLDAWEPIHKVFPTSLGAVAFGSERQPRINQISKRPYTKPTAMTYVNPARNYLPEPFGSTTPRKETLVGVRFSPKDALLYRLFVSNLATYNRPYDFNTIDEAVGWIERQIAKGRLHNDMDSLVNEALTHYVQENNEVHARARVCLDGTFQYVVFRNNLPSRLLAQDRARAMKKEIEHVTKRKINLIPISFYPQMTYYSESAQKEDRLVDALNGDHPEQLPACVAELDASQKVELLKIQNKDGWTALNLVARYHPEQLPACLAELDASQKVELLKIQNKDGWTALNLVARYHPEQLPACLAELDASQKVELLKIQNKDGWDALNLVARYHSEQLPACLAELDAPQKVELLKIKNHHGVTALMLVARYHPEQLPACLAELDAPQKVELLNIKNNDGCTALMYVALYHPNQLRACVAEYNTAQKVKLLKIKNHHGVTALMQLAAHHPEQLTACLAELDAPQKVELLTIQNEDGWTALMLVADYHPKQLPACLAELDAPQKVELLTIQNVDGWTALMFVARDRPTQLPACLAELDAPQKVELLKIQNKDDWIALMFVARYHPKQLLACLAELDAPQKVEFLKIQNKDGWIALMLVARYHPEQLTACLAGLESLQKIDLLTSLLSLDETRAIHAKNMPFNKIFLEIVVSNLSYKDLNGKNIASIICLAQHRLRIVAAIENEHPIKVATLISQEINDESSLLHHILNLDLSTRRCATTSEMKMCRRIIKNKNFKEIELPELKRVPLASVP